MLKLKNIIANITFCPDILIFNNNNIL